MALGNYGTQRGGQGEAVILNPQGFYNQVLAQDRYKRQQAAINDRIAAKQKADQDKAKKDELYKMSAQTGGPARYLAPYAAQARKELNDEISKDIEKGVYNNENVYRLKLNAIDAFEKQGLATGEDIDRRMVDLQKDQFIKGAPFVEAYRANLDDAIKKHLAEGKPYSSFIVDQNDLIKKSMADTRYDIYDPIAIGESIRKQYPVRTVQQPPKPGRTTSTTKASPFFKTDSTTGLAIPELDYEKVNQAFNSPSFRPFVEQSFARELTNPNSFYFQQTTKNKEALKDDPEEFAAVQNALKKRYLENEILENTALTNKALPFDQTFNYTSRPSGGGRGKQPPKVVFGKAAPVVMESYTKPSKPGEVGEKLLSVPIFGSDAAEKQTPILIEEKTPPSVINISADQVIRKQPIPPQSEFDIANPQYTTLPILKKNIKVTYTKNGVTKTTTFKKGTVIGQGDEFAGENKGFISLVANEAAKGDNIKYQFGVLLPTYSKQFKIPTQSEIEAAQKLGISQAELEYTYGSKKLGTFQGWNFFERDMSPASLFSKASAAGKNLFRGMDIRQMENNSLKTARPLYESELGIKPVAFKTSNRYKTGQASKPVAPKTTPLPADNFFK